MSLTPGTTLGPYQIVASIGAGGMGEVYRARDTRLGREVALKTLPAALTADPDQRARFEREARAASSLNHPHICVIHDVGSQAGIDFLVMELLEGETVEERLARGPMSLGEVMRVGSQIADALDRAHRKGLVHRDLKPANIMLVGGSPKSNRVHAKLLDFGLARPVSTEAQSATMTKALTAAGSIVGTFHYMSPEQVEGREVDARTDIWSLGATLYEMATGVRAFDGPSAASLISAVLRDQPSPMGERTPITPPAFERLVSQCLEKDPDDRWQSAGDVKRELDWIAAGSGVGSTVVAPAHSPAPAARSQRLIYGAAVVALGVVIAAGGWWLGRQSNRVREPAWSEFTQLTDASGVETGPSLSPDGGSFAYSSSARGSSDIYVQRVGGRNPVLVAGDPARDEVWPTFSPDGQQIAFSLSGTGGIFVVGATGESVRRVTDVGSNPVWSPDGQRIAYCTEEVRTPYNTFASSTLWAADLNGGAPVKLEVTGVPALDAGFFQPAWSPSGGRIAFWTNSNGQRDIGTIAAAGGAAVMLTSDAAVDWAPVWSPDGRFLYFASDRGGSMGIWRVALDETSGTATASPEPIAAGVDVAMDLPRLSTDGTSLVFRSKIQSVNPAAIAFDPATERAGEVKLLQRRTGFLIPTDVSPDGRLIALHSMFDRQHDIFTMRSDGSELSRLTDDLARDWDPRFTPDGTALVFYSNRSGTYDGWSIRLDGSNRTRLTEFGVGVAYIQFAPDGRRIFAATINGDFMFGSPPWPVTPATAKAVKPQSLAAGTLLPSRWSPNGRWLTGPLLSASSLQRGNALYDIEAGTAKQLSDDAASVYVAWTPDHTRVIYFTADGKLVIQNVATLARREIAVTLPLPPEDLWSITASPDGRTLYYGAQQVEANIWKVERAKATTN
jgi:eukaryotic-like serine/threonine-protein kinase